MTFKPAVKLPALVLKSNKSRNDRVKGKQTFDKVSIGTQKRLDSLKTRPP